MMIYTRVVMTALRSLDLYEIFQKIQTLTNCKDETFGLLYISIVGDMKWNYLVSSLPSTFDSEQTKNKQKVFQIETKNKIDRKRMEIQQVSNRHGKLQEIIDAAFANERNHLINRGEKNPLRKYVPGTIEYTLEKLMPNYDIISERLLIGAKEYHDAHLASTNSFFKEYRTIEAALRGQ